MNKRGIGIRVYSGSVIYYSIIEHINNNESLLDVGKLNVPQCIGNPDALSFVRNTFIDIFNQYKVNSAVIRVAEMTANLNKNSILRIYIEGVIQECIAGSFVNSYHASRINTISSFLRIKSSNLKKIISGDEDLSSLTNLEVDWETLMLEEREAVISSLCAVRRL